MTRRGRAPNPSGALAAAMAGMPALSPRRRRRRTRRRPRPANTSTTTFADVLARFRAAPATPDAEPPARHDANPSHERTTP